MRLEKIVLNGFKSFADKTEFNFDSQITAIVGPNGCGKSNTVDAVKWVLGEQRMKSLRSGHLTDVIFSGSSSRKAIGSAEVSLFFSNPGKITAGNVQIESDEIQITRRISKDGTSDCLINNKPCRLKDIRELFMDTGVSTKAYSIIEQGQVEQLLNASKSDRRSIFEEAAGISKYKAHKNEALRKLDRTEQNLLRLADIVSEVEKNLRSVKLQAGKARNYLKYSERLKELQANYYLTEYAKNRTQSESKTGKLKTFENSFAEIAAQAAKNNALASELPQKKAEAEKEFNLNSNQLVAVQGKIEQQLQQIEFLRTRIEELGLNRTRAESKTNQLQEQKNVIAKDAARCENEQSNCQRQLAEKKESADEIQQTLRMVNKECVQLEADLEDEKSGIIDIVRMTAQLHNEVQSISVYRTNLSSQKERLTSRADDTKSQLEKILTEKAQQSNRLLDVEKVLGQLQENLDTKHKKSEEINASIANRNSELSRSKEARSALSSEMALLTEMELKKEGLNNAVRSILESRQSQDGKFAYVKAMLADVVDADAEYANAVEAVLEGKTDALIVDDTNQMTSEISQIEKLNARVNFICADKIKPFEDNKDLSKFDGVKGRIVEFVKYKSEYAPLVWHLLGKTIVVDSIDAAMKISDELGADYEFVTLKGEVYNSAAMVKVGQLGISTGLISRKSRVRQLQESISDITSEIAMAESQIEHDTEENEHLEKLCKELRTAIYEASTEKMQVGSKIAVCEQEIKRLRQEQPLLISEIDQLESQIEQSVKKEYDSKQKLQELETVNSQRSARIAQLQSKCSEQKEQRTTLMDKVSDLRVAIGQIAEQDKSLKQTLEHLQNQMRENQIAEKTAKEEIQDCIGQLEKAADGILKCEADVSGLFVEKENCQKNGQLLREKIENLSEEQKQAEEIAEQKRTHQNEIEQNINQLKIELSQLEVKIQDLTERVSEELQIDLAKSYENYQENNVDWSQVREEITDLKTKIERLGNVNLDAIESQIQLEQRHEFLSTQVEDLTGSKNQLQQLINRLNKQSREKFAQTFEEIRGHFQQLFRKLFGGGKADVILEEADDILEAGVEIIARPPGKETRSISLLSGGERTMTALALLFAVFKAKPSPFCFLDEVDAALDEANNERFNLLIREFQADSQFIIITHSKRTMSIADALFGVTMQTAGVSKKIGVRFSQIDEDQETVAVA